MSFCLPQAIANKFLDALKSGEVDPGKLAEMSSAERRSFFTNLVGEENARDVNALFESKLLLKNQQAGMVRWAKSLTGLTETAKRDIVSRIERMDKALDAPDQDKFLADLAAQKLGTDVTFGEAQKITELSKDAQVARDELKQAPTDQAAQMKFGRATIDMAEYVNSLKPQPSIWTFTNIVNLPKTALTSVLHFSAPLVQGWGSMTTGAFWKGIPEMFKYFADEENYKNLQGAIVGHPDYSLAVKAKLGIVDLGDKLSTREEALQSSLLEHVPGLRVPVIASSRAFTGFLNYVRFNNFIKIIEAARLNGEDVSPGSQSARDAARVVNNFTGRGAIGVNDRYAQSVPMLNNAFFSPRKMSATINMFNPEMYARLTPTARVAALRQLSGSLIATGAMLELLHLMGANVNVDPTNTDFLKARFGKTTFDLTGGNATYARLWGRLIEGKSTSAAGRVTDLTSNTFGSQTRASLVLDFFRGKTAPVASTLWDYLAGKDLGGNKTTFLFDPTDPKSVMSTEEFNKMVPIVMQSFAELIVGGTPNPIVWAPAMFALFGVDMQTSTK